MKKFFYLMSLALCMFMGAAALSSCGDDELVPATISEDTKANTLTVQYDGGGCVTKYVATFDSNDKCIKYLEYETYSSKDEAKEEYEWGGKGNPKITLDGKSIIYDRTDEYKGKSKEEIRAYFQSIVDEFNED
ncbi:MAG: hypothetical protein J5671_06295 [Bacteroidaceae bacterium]|nr:hypothetical protein [Bacteroidaceae bacterium]